MAKNRVDSKW